MPDPATCPITSKEALVARRRALSKRLGGPALLAAGRAPARNYPANPYDFRASSHFLYFTAQPMEGAAVLFHDGECTLLAQPADPEDALWHGPRPSFEALADALGVDDVKSVGDAAEVVGALESVATLPPQDAQTAQWLSGLLGRTITPGGGARLDGPDAALADAMIALRLVHDEAAVAQMRFSAAVSVEAHLAGMRATRPGAGEQVAYAAMVDVFRRHGCADAYPPIVTVHGEVLHQHAHDGTTADGELLLADVGAESAEGWAADITRTWPVGGSYSGSQRAIYDVVLEAQRRAIALATPGRPYRDVHETAKRTLVEGLVALGILRGEVDGLLERGAAALFFPHGVGHIIGLDVHDMEDLGDRAGYAPGRERAAAFGDAFLRLDRDLSPGMAVTIEPGFYQVPGILADDALTAAVGDDLRRDKLAEFADVRGIRIEDDVLITEAGNEVLTGALPKAASEVEAVVHSG